MNIVGLDAVISKEEVVQTQHAIELLDHPDKVKHDYEQYVRSYIPLGQQGQEGRSVADFERRVIREVKEKKVPRGYITADYGYGKTSTCLYLWKRAKDENLLAIPPFRMVLLSDLITATYGWLRYEISRTLPNSPLIQATIDLYDNTMARSEISVAEQYNMSRADAKRLIHDKPQVLDLNEADYLRFFDEATAIAVKAGFEGLLILADEVQQYIDPEVKAGIRDPLSPLFNLISGLITRRNNVPIGIIFVIPPRELENLRSQRGDFNQRIQPGLDLRTIYDRDFPNRLWHLLAEQFGFLDHAEQIITKETLRCLGQISMRHDLSDGPRTVVNVFRRITKRYRDAEQPEPYTPLDLIEDFLAQRITFDSSQKIRRVTNQVLDHHLVKGYPDRELAIKWAAAFPEEGLKRDRQKDLGLLEAVDELMHSANRDLMIGVGSRETYGVTLREFRNDGKTDTLSLLVDEFWRQYQDTDDQTRLRTMRAFFNLLTNKVFPTTQWKVLEERFEDLMTRNQGLILEGSFASFKNLYPERELQVRVLWEDEPVKDINMDRDYLIQFRLKRHFDQPEAERSKLHDPLKIQFATRQITVTLNLMCLDETLTSANLNEAIQDIIEPYKLTPLLMLSLYDFIEEKRAKHQISESDDQTIHYGFQPDLLDNIFHLLFNKEVGQPVQAAQERILELASHQLLEFMYPDYKTLMRVGNWSASLTRYRNALNRLELPEERQGQINVEGTKKDIADKFPLTHSALDTFMNNFSLLIKEETPLTTNSRDIEAGKKGAVRFTLHPLEQQIREWLRQDGQPQTTKNGLIHRLSKTEIDARAKKAGYREKEIDEILNLMKERGLVEENRLNEICEQISQSPSIDELEAAIIEWQRDLNILAQGYNSSQLQTWRENADKALKTVQEKLRQGGNSSQIIGARRQVQNSRHDLAGFVKDQRGILATDLKKLQIPRPNALHGKKLEELVKGGVSYVEQVNDLRSRLLKRYTELVTQSGTYQQQAEALGFNPNDDELPLERLVQIRQAYQALHRQLSPLKDKCEAADKDYTHFDAWTKLVDLGSDLTNDIQQLGDLVKPHQQALHDLAKNITGHLSAHKLAALPEAPRFDSDLRAIKTKVQILKNESTSRFTDLQERYRQVLTQKVKFPREKLWLPHSYNPTAPEDSYNRLIYDVQNTLRELSRQLSKNLKKFQGDTESSLQSPLLKKITADKQTEINTTAQVLLTSFKKNQELLTETERLVEDSKLIQDFPLEGESQFMYLLDRLEKILNTIPNLVSQVKQLQDTLSAGELTAEEELFIKTLAQPGMVELGSLRKNVALTDDLFWATLRSLHEKQRIRLSLEAIQ